MSKQIRSGFTLKLLICASVALLTFGSPASALAKTYQVDCTKKGELQKTIDAAVDDDLIEITGICMENIVIADKSLQLVGASTPGPHGITGVTEGKDAVLIVDSRHTYLEGLQIYNPHFTGVRIVRHSFVVMNDCDVSNSMAGEASGIWVRDQSQLEGNQLRLNGNLRGLHAFKRSEAVCRECELNGNTIAATAYKSSTVILVDNVVTGPRGLYAEEYSLADMHCRTSVPDVPCGLNVTGVAASARWHSEIVFSEVGDFSGWLRVRYGSKAWLNGARQVENTHFNEVHDNSSLRVDSGSSSNSLLTGHTLIHGFSNALFYSANTELAGNLQCESGGDAWIDPGIDLSGLSIDGCMNAPTP